METHQTDSGKQKKLPVTILSGFLGAGKTTLLQHILKNKVNLRCAVIVNDMAELNIDAEIVKNSNIIQKEEKLVTLQNGCICCTLREDLCEEVAKLALENKFDYLVIESTGISDPMQVAEKFEFELDPSFETTGDENVLKELSQLDCCVTVVDASNFFKFFKSKELASDQLKDVDQSDDRSIFQLMIDQIEFSNVVLLNKCDLVTDQEKEEVKNAILQFNHKAEIIETVKSNVDLTKILNTGKFNFEEAESNSKWLGGDRQWGHQKTMNYNIQSFIYKRTRPFHPERLHKLLEDNFMLDVQIPDQEDLETVGKDHGHDHSHGHDHGHDHAHDHNHAHDEPEGEDQGEEEEDDEEYMAKLKESFKLKREESFKKQQAGIFKNLFRSKGFIWLSNRPKYFFEWAQASVNTNITIGGPWVCSISGKSLQWQADNNEIGDRAINLIFIGQNITAQEKEMTEVLDKCLVDEEEWKDIMANQITHQLKFDPFDIVEEDEEEQE